MFSRFQWDSKVFDSLLISRALKAIDISVPRTPKPKQIFSIQNLTDLVHLTDSHPWGIVLKPLFLLAFFAFLRISNLLPQSSTHYDPHYTLLRKDIVFKSGMAIVTLRFTKSRQSRSSLTHIQVPSLSTSPYALSGLFRLYYIVINFLLRLLFSPSALPLVPRPELF